MSSSTNKTLSRNTTIDILRALTMLIMIFVNDFWKIHDVPHWLEHAAYKEDFLGLADFVFPIFLFVVGLSIPYAIENRYNRGNSAESTLSHILSRTFALLMMGVFIGNSEARLHGDVPYSIGVYWIAMVLAFILVWNMYPKNTRKKPWVYLLQAFGVLILLYLAFSFKDPNGGVFMARWGILGSIGFSYVFCALTYILLRQKSMYIVVVWTILVILCIVNTPLREHLGGNALVNIPKPNFYHSFLALFHIGNGVLPAFTMSGLLFSLGIIHFEDKSQKWIYKILLVLIFSFLFLGLLSHQFWIASKISGTPPWLFYTISSVIAVYLVIHLLEKQGWTKVFHIIRPAGTATLTVYLIPYLFYAFAEITGFALPDILTHGTMGLVNCFCFAVIVILIVGQMERIYIKLKI